MSKRRKLDNTPSTVQRELEQIDLEEKELLQKIYDLSRSRDAKRQKTDAAGKNVKVNAALRCYKAFNSKIEANHEYTKYADALKTKRHTYNFTNYKEVDSEIFVIPLTKEQETVVHALASNSVLDNIWMVKHASCHVQCVGGQAPSKKGDNSITYDFPLYIDLLSADPHGNALDFVRREFNMCKVQDCLSKEGVSPWYQALFSLAVKRRRRIFGQAIGIPSCLRIREGEKGIYIPNSCRLNFRQTYLNLHEETREPIFDFTDGVRVVDDEEASLITEIEVKRQASQQLPTRPIKRTVPRSGRVSKKRGEEKTFMNEINNKSYKLRKLIDMMSIWNKVIIFVHSYKIHTYLLEVLHKLQEELSLSNIVDMNAFLSKAEIEDNWRRFRPSDSCYRTVMVHSTRCRDIVDCVVRKGNDIPPHHMYPMIDGILLFDSDWITDIHNLVAKRCSQLGVPISELTCSELENLELKLLRHPNNSDMLRLGLESDDDILAYHLFTFAMVEQEEFKQEDIEFDPIIPMPEGRVERLFTKLCTWVRDTVGNRVMEVSQGLGEGYFVKKYLRFGDRVEEVPSCLHILWSSPHNLTERTKAQWVSYAPEPRHARLLKKHSTQRRPVSASIWAYEDARVRKATRAVSEIYSSICNEKKYQTINKMMTNTFQLNLLNLLANGEPLKLSVLIGLFSADIPYIKRTEDQFFHFLSEPKEHLRLLSEKFASIERRVKDMKPIAMPIEGKGKTKRKAASEDNDYNETSKKGGKDY